ncbi:putative Chaperone protein DNAJ [Leptomonas seymouri]|uniref:Putative Chaperone protein DNAJ n=1 Tax=Leptomonas seymouri TaxID=5684 RepID=A0A0N1IML6_LEPSE|nr:putative Chaperone protein DNAJ [Leptomonas seymouri]|eukprot:KPI90142.1 putative Chaperone protein DNAJ [Leptomonas seymouri]
MCESSIYDLKGNTALYEVLGVPQTATQREIRQAYYRLAVVYHPDKNPDGGDVFKEVSFAHGVLSDPQQRAMYDRGTLRSDIESKARTYDPSMDPNVELSPEMLRAFVDRVRQSHDAKQQMQSAFEQRREEEMKRRAEYDARNPAFRAEYERARHLRQRGLGSTVSSYAALELAVAKPRTSAEILAELMRKEQEGAFSQKPVSASSSDGGTLSYKQRMMAQYRATHDQAEGGACSTAAASSSHARQSALPFVRAQCDTPQYSETVDEKLQTYANFDYRAYIEQERNDRAEVEDAIMADALGQYDRNH